MGHYTLIPAKQAALKIAELKASECVCERCVEMCRRTPCWGTPDDVRKIIEAGLGGRLMTQYWVNSDEGDTQMVQPAIVGHEGGSSPWMPIGRCTFLDDAGRCELHAAGLKPTEGRLAVHDGHENDTPNELHSWVAATWQTYDAQQLVDDEWGKR